MRVDNDKFYKMLSDKNLTAKVPRQFDIQDYYDAGVVKKDDLIDGVYYQGICRNADVAKWDKQNNCFWYMRFKFHPPMLTEAINHMADDNGYDLFMPFQKLNDDEINDDEKIK